MFYSYVLIGEAVGFIEGPIVTLLVKVSVDDRL